MHFMSAKNRPGELVIRITSREFSLTAISAIIVVLRYRSSTIYKREINMSKYSKFRWLPMLYVSLLAGCIFPSVSIEAQDTVAAVTPIGQIVRMHWMGSPERPIKEWVENALYGQSGDFSKDVTIADLKKLGFVCPISAEKKCFFKWFIVHTLHGLPTPKGSETIRVEIHIDIDANKKPIQISVLRRDTVIE